MSKFVAPTPVEVADKPSDFANEANDKQAAFDGFIRTIVERGLIALPAATLPDGSRDGGKFANHLIKVNMSEAAKRAGCELACNWSKSNTNALVWVVVKVDGKSIPNDATLAMKDGKVVVVPAKPA